MRLPSKFLKSKAKMPAQALRLSMVKMGMNQAIISLVINRMPGTSGLKITGDDASLSQ